MVQMCPCCKCLCLVELNFGMKRPSSQAPSTRMHSTSLLTSKIGDHMQVCSMLWWIFSKYKMRLLYSYACWWSCLYLHKEIWRGLDNAWVTVDKISTSYKSRLTLKGDTLCKCVKVHQSETGLVISINYNMVTAILQLYKIQIPVQGIVPDYIWRWIPSSPFCRWFVPLPCNASPIVVACSWLCKVVLLNRKICCDCISLQGVL